ncbi:MAG: Kelch repeat-containing protein [Candidatus Poribacteria bacterium]
MMEKVKKSKQIKLLVLIGIVGLNFCFLFGVNAEDGKWAKKGDMPTAKLAPSCVVDGKIYLVGGMSESPNPLSILEEYDPKTDKWTKKADMPTPRGMLSVCALNEKLYAIGGVSPGTTSATEEYDPKTDKWTKKADIPTPRSFLSACAVNGKIYAIGGINESLKTLPTVEEYDPITNKWTKKANMLTPRAFFSAVAFNNKIYCFGGLAKAGPMANGRNKEEIYLSSVEEYDPITDKWTKKADMPTGRAGLSASVVDGFIYAMGGQTASGEKVFLAERPISLSTVEKYDPITDKWTKISNMPTARYALTTAVVNNKIYVFGGSEDTIKPCSKVEEFTPEK